MSPTSLNQSESALSRLRRFATAVFAIIGALCVAILAIPRVLSFVWPHDADARVIKVVHSPDRKYKAVLFNDNGGGAFAPYCFDFVYVVPVSVADASANRDTYLVYSGSCHPLEFQSQAASPRYVNAPQLRWSSNSQLEIAFDPTLAAQGIKELTFRALAAEGKVRIAHRQPSDEWK
jgi:hypothetical protein